MLISVVLYFVHEYLQYQYYVRCRSNLIKVILLQRSDMCIQLHNFLTVIEAVYSKDVFALLNRVTDYVPAPSTLF